MKIRRRMGETKQIVQVNGGNILLFELAFRLLTLPLLLQAVRRCSGCRCARLATVM